MKNSNHEIQMMSSLAISRSEVGGQGGVPVGEKLDAFTTFLACIGFSSIAGLAALLRSGKELTARSLATALLYSSAMGLLIGLLWWSQFGGDKNPYFTIALSGLAGIGGTTLLDFALQVIARGGLNITIHPGDRPDKKQ